MDNNREQIEGQAVAKAILAGDANAWKDFQLLFGDAIARIASKRAKSPKLRSEFSGDDIVNGFMAEKLLDRPERMFGPAAKGQRPLAPRLLSSLGKYCNSLQRRRRRTVHSEMSLDLHPDERGDDNPDYNPQEAATLTKKRIEDQQRIIREAFSGPSRIRVPQREILLLSERILFAEQVAASYCRENQSSSERDAANQLVCTLYSWSDDESATLIPMINHPLSTIWHSISHDIFNPPFGVDSYMVADRIQVLRNTWDIWVRRARQRVIASAGVQKPKELFPHWPRRLFETKLAKTDADKGAQRQ